LWPLASNETVFDRHLGDHHIVVRSPVLALFLRAPHVAAAGYRRRLVRLRQRGSDRAATCVADGASPQRRRHRQSDVALTVAPRLGHRHLAPADDQPGPESHPGGAPESASVGPSPPRTAASPLHGDRRRRTQVRQQRPSAAASTLVQQGTAVHPTNAAVRTGC